MKHIARSTGRIAGLVILSIATFALWAGIASVAGWVLFHLPDFWVVHRASVDNVLYANMAVSAYALLAGALFLVFSCCAMQSLASAAREIARATRHLRRVRRQAVEPQLALS